MIGLDQSSAGFLYSEFSARRVQYRQGTRPVLDAIARGVAGPNLAQESRVRYLAQFVSALQPERPQEVEDVRFGGTEEEIIARGSDWCGDLARVTCALLQTARIPARLIQLADTRKAYTGHTIVEAFRRGAWGAVDPMSNVVYSTPSGRPASTWDLMVHPDWLRRFDRGRATPYARAGQFRRVAISNYLLGRKEDCDYSVSRVNSYYRSILGMSDRGWPGGVRWLRGEDRAAA